MRGSRQARPTGLRGVSNHRDRCCATSSTTGFRERPDRGQQRERVDHHREDEQRDRERPWPASHNASDARPKTTTLTSGRRSGPPYVAFGDAKRDQAVIATRGSSHTHSQRGSCAQPHTPNAATASSSSTKTRASTHQPRMVTVHRARLSTRAVHAVSRGTRGPASSSRATPPSGRRGTTSTPRAPRHGWRRPPSPREDVAEVHDVDADGVPCRLYRPTERPATGW